MDRINDLVNAVEKLADIMSEMNEGHHYTAMKIIESIEKLDARIIVLEKKVEPDVDVEVYEGDDGLLWVDVYVNRERKQHYTQDID